MKARRRSDGKVIEVEPQRFIEQDGSMYAPSDLDFNVEESEEVTIDGWVARDKNRTLCLFPTEPIRPIRAPHWRIVRGLWIELNKNLFPDLTWESEPLEVTITIKPKKKQ